MKIIPLYFYVLLLSFLSLANAIPNLATNFVTQASLAYDSFVAFWVPAPPDFNFWDEAQKLGNKAVQYADKQLQEKSREYSVAWDKIEEFKQSMKDLINSTEALQLHSPGALVERDFNYTLFSEKLSTEIDVVIADLMLEFKEPPPENQTERYQRREAAVIKALEKMEDALVKVYSFWSVPELEARLKFAHVKPQIKHVVLVTGNLCDNHPVLVDIVLFSAALMIIPESIFLRPLLRVFGFGSLGPVKGSPAAWAQRSFFNAAVKEGSWFARLQSAGMKWVPPGLGKKIGIPAVIGAGIIGSFRAST
ncbi:hypothetical protein GALMADRAFT_502065 [Galerina marginata CBS 339.88]|uniref:Uncharacterized protein n=1 Tax=Galerina marginata (strain CBS 339.88) TaxID=685588 RepID=A0A067SY15_GALM3|nr:hypothetical protein GALMADRAFT_502065 [Galerina marginata CBS 339.88]